MKSKSLIAMLLCAMMLVSLLPAAVFADEAEEEIVDVFFGEEAETAPAEESSQEDEIPAEDEIIPEEDDNTVPAEDEESFEDEELPAEEGEPGEEPETEDAENEFAAVVSSGTCGARLSWELSDDGVLKIRGSGNMDDFTGYGPWIDYLSRKKDITGVVFEGSVKSIGSYAFNGLENLTAVDFGSCQITSIGSNAFKGCWSLESITLPSSLTRIGDSAFLNCYNLKNIIPFTEKNVVVPAITAIGEDAFASNNFEYFHIPASVSSIGSHTPFWGNLSLKEINVAADNAYFKSEDGVLFSKGGTVVIAYPPAKEDISYGIPSGVSTVQAYSFMGAGNLKEVYVPGSVTNISVGAFASCVYLESINISQNINMIESMAFMYDIGLKTINFRGKAPSIAGDAFSSVTATAYYKEGVGWSESNFQNYGGTLTWKKSAETGGECGDDLFWKYKDGTLTISGTGKMYDYEYGESPWYGYRLQVKSVVIENGAESIGKCAFTECSNVTDVSIPDSVESIGQYAFSHCDALENVTLPKNLKTLGEAAFLSCGLIRVIIPASVTAIDGHPFYRNTKLTEIKVESGNKNYKDIDGVLFTIDGKKLMEYPHAKGGAYSVPDGVNTIEMAAFAYSRNITEITIPKSVKIIDTVAFADCFGLKSIKFLGDAPSIFFDAFLDLAATVYYPAGNSTWTSEVMRDYKGNDITWAAYELQQLEGKCGDTLTWAFYNGTLTISGTGAMYDFEYGTAPWFNLYDSIESIVIENGATCIGRNAFAGCKNVTSAVIPDSVESIGKNAFSHCEALENIILPKNLKWISTQAFEFSGLVKVTVPASVTDVISYAFFHCDNLTEIKVESGNTKYKDIDGVLFTIDGRTLIEYPHGREGAYSIPQGTIIITSSAFPYSYKLTEVTIPGSAVNIERYAFDRCKNLSCVKFTGNAPEIEHDAFSSVTATAYYPAGNKTWTSDVMQQYGGKITWVPYTTEIQVEHAAPVITTVANHADYMIVSWGKVEGAASYQLAYREGSSAWQSMDVTLLMVDSKGNPRVNLKNLKQGANYTFIAYALFADGSKTKSASATQTRLLTPNVQVKAGNGYVNLTWNEVQGGSQYKIYYREKGGSWQLYAWVKKGVTSINIKESVINANGQTPLIKGHTYEFAVILGTSVAGITSGFPTTPVSVKY